MGLRGLYLQHMAVLIEPYLNTRLYKQRGRRQRNGLISPAQ